MGAEIEIGSLRPGHEASFIMFDVDELVDVRNDTEAIGQLEKGSRLSAGILTREHSS